MLQCLNGPIGESAKGTAPSAARRTVREPLDAHGSPSRALPYHSRQWTNSSDSRRDTLASQRRLRRLCPRSVLYCRHAPRARVRSKCRQTVHTAVGEKLPSYCHHPAKLALEGVEKVPRFSLVWRGRGPWAIGGRIGCWAGPLAPGRQLIKRSPARFCARRGRNVKPRKVHCIGGSSPPRLLSLQETIPVLSGCTSTPHSRKRAASCRFPQGACRSVRQGPIPSSA